MTSTTNPSASFHSYDNAVYDEQQTTANGSSSQSSSGNHLQQSHYNKGSPSSTLTPNTTVNATNCSGTISTKSNVCTDNGCCSASLNKNLVDSPFPDLIHDSNSSNICSTSAHILSTTESSSGGTIRLTSKTVPGQELVTKLITLPSITSMDSFKEWSINSFKCAKQIINEKRGIGTVTNDVQLQSDIDQLRNNQNRLIKFLKIAQHLKNNYTNLVNDQKQLYTLMSELSIKSFSISSLNHQNGQTSSSSPSKSAKKLNGKQIVANFSSLGNNLSSSFTTNHSPKHSPNNGGHGSSSLNDFMPVFNHIKSSSTNITEDFKKNAMILNTSIRNGEKLITALNFFCSNLYTLIYKTMEDTILTIKQLESVRLEYDAERNSLNSISASMPSQSINTAYSSDRLDLAKTRYDQLRVDVQIKMRFLEENVIKVVHKQLILFNSAFASYSSGNTNALDATLKQFSIK